MQYYSDIYEFAKSISTHIWNHDVTYLQSCEHPHTPPNLNLGWIYCFDSPDVPIRDFGREFAIVELDRAFAIINGEKWYEFRSNGGSFSLLTYDFHVTRADTATGEISCTCGNPMDGIDDLEDIFIPEEIRSKYRASKCRMPTLNVADSVTFTNEHNSPIILPRWCVIKYCARKYADAIAKPNSSFFEQSCYPLRLFRIDIAVDDRMATIVMDLFEHQKRPATLTTKQESTLESIYDYLTKR